MARLPFAVTTLAAVLLLSGCPAPALLMPGLTLPPGSVEVTRMTQLPPGGAPAMPGMGNVDKTLVIGFNNSLGWPGVSAHFDAFMKGKGYEESMTAMAGMLQGSMPPGTPDMLGDMRMYQKNGEKYTVMLNNMSAMMEAAKAYMPAGSSAAMPPGAAASMGEFSVTVLKYK